MKRFSQSPFTIKKLMLEQCVFIITNTDTNTANLDWWLATQTFYWVYTAS